MLSEEKYIDIVNNVLNKNLRDNSAQKKVVLSPVNNNQYIVAGPGSGKTTALVLKILKYIFVDEVPAENIMVTTFTKKASRELKTRIYSWAEEINNYLNNDEDFNLDKLIIGTIDSISEDLLSTIYEFDVIDNFTSSAIMMQTLLTNGRNNDKKLKQFFKKIKGHYGGSTTSDMNSQLQNIKERIFYDMIDINELTKNADKEETMYTIFDEYFNHLSKRHIFDYPLLEKRFYDALISKIIDRITNLQVLLIDEYQDTNLLQEQIYFKLASIVKDNDGNITVVGDDDQSLYRFRGSVVHLFTDYVNRINNELGITPETVYLQKNYRSTKNIIDFNNEFIHLDKWYQDARTVSKPLILPSDDSSNGLPVYGLFRNNLEELAHDLSDLIYDIKTKNKYVYGKNGKSISVSDKENPTIALLTNSPKEINAFNKKRLPFYIRELLADNKEEIAVFNPRGQDIENTMMVSVICGLILLSIDAKGVKEEELENIPPHTKKTIKSWRQIANDYISTSNLELIEYSDDINLVKLLEDIDTEIKSLVLESNENKIYHDIIMDTILQTNEAIGTDTLTDYQIFWHILIPIATGAIDVDDDVFDVNLEDNVNIMSIHQAKGLEFDVVIVDVGSDIFNKSRNTAFKRFPIDGGKTHNIEKYLMEYSDLSDSYEKITGRDESFNDIIRRYFVAYTRAKSVLILVGLNNMRYGYRGDFQDNILIPNVATGWSRDEVWHWEHLDNLYQI